ncbi:MAG: TonB-dependent receptor plug domain-containing protein [Bacteroidales bacterium]|nr:TonB-dependent receptor plug domain-containing protein [Bacteroidales bacterium]
MKSRIIFIGLLLACGTLAAAQEKDTLKMVRVGYFEGDSRAITGTADKVTEDKMNKGLVNNSLEALSGQSAGVTISRGNSAIMLDAVRVRGTTSLTGGNDPLVIIDGVAADLATLNTIYPADIESFTILKDAAQTAQYGSRGASGPDGFRIREDGRGEDEQVRARPQQPFGRQAAEQ